MHDSRKTSVREVGKKGCIYVKKKYNGFWLCHIFSIIFSLIFLAQKKSFNINLM